MRNSCRLIVGLLAIPSPSVAQGRRGAPPSGPEFDFKVELPADGARLTGLKTQAARMVDSMSPC